jgi:hypothetical protein
MGQAVRYVSGWSSGCSVQDDGHCCRMRALIDCHFWEFWLCPGWNVEMETKIKKNSDENGRRREDTRALSRARFRHQSSTVWIQQGADQAISKRSSLHHHLSSSSLNCPTPPCSCNDLPWLSRAAPPWLRPSAAAWPPRPSVVSPPAPKVDSFHAKSRKPGRSCDTPGCRLPARHAGPRWPN